MPRNFDWRVEVLVPIRNERVHAQLMERIMVFNMKDSEQSWALGADGEYSRMHAEEGENFNVHQAFMDAPDTPARRVKLTTVSP